MMNILLKIKNKFYVLGLILLIGAQSVLVTLQMSVDREDITIGDLFSLTLTLTAQKDVVLEQFDPAAHLEAFEIKDFSIDEPRRKFGKTIQTYTYQLSTFISGTYTIPSFDVPYKTPEGKQESIKSPALKIEVKPVAPREGEKDDIRDIKPVLRMPVSTIAIITAVALVLLLAGIWLYLYIRRRNKMRGLKKAFEVIRPPHEIAFEKLNELLTLDLVAAGRIKEFYIILSEIIRQYLARRFSIGVMDKTTVELYKDLRQSEATKKHSADIKDFLSECDLVKFAKYTPDARVIDEDIAHARAIVEQTREQEINNVE